MSQEVTIVEANALSPHKILLKECVHLEKELDRHQREFKRKTLFRFKKRSEKIIEESVNKSIKTLKEERKDLRAQIYTADGKAFNSQNSRFITSIKCHVECQEMLMAEIHKLKTQIKNVEHDIGSLNKQIYKLQLKTESDEQRMDFVKQMRKKLTGFEDKLEVGIHRECEMASVNEKLREEINSLMENRNLFIQIFTKLVTKLNNEKKYLLELTKYALMGFEECTNFQEKIINVIKKMAKDNEHYKDEMQSTVRNRAKLDEVSQFIEIKNKFREIAPLQDKEIKRRKEFSRVHTRKIQLYKKVLAKLVDYAEKNFGEGNENTLVSLFTEQENLYYAYCSMENEIGFHVTLINNSVNHLYREIDIAKLHEMKRTREQNELIAKLQETLEQKRKKSEKSQAALETADKRLDQRLNKLMRIFNMCYADAAPLMQLIGDHSVMTKHNFKGFLKILEEQVKKIVAYVYISERNNTNIPPDKYKIQEVFKVFEFVTDLNDIVRAQQCPECAEGEALDTEAGEAALLMSKQEIEKQLFEKVVQPEMQYRLHSLSECRLPRSRILTAKRNGD